MKCLAQMSNLFILTMSQILVLLLLYSVGTIAKSVPEFYSSGNGPLDLTPLIERGEVEKARNLSAVDPTIFAGVPSHAAHITANKTRNWHLFFWFFPVQHQPLESTPWIIWLQGGPGCSSMLGLFSEIGPITVSKDLKATKMPITWGSNYSLLFIDNPVQTGYSYSDDGSVAETEDEVGDTLLRFLEQFVQVFPELQKAPLFIAGESYAGKYIPALGHYIHNRNNRSIPINLKGLSIGDGFTDPLSLMYRSEWGIGTGLLDFKQANQLKKHEEAARKYWAEGKLEEYYREARMALQWPALLDPYNYMKDFMPQKEKHANDFVVLPDVRKALHVGNSTFRDCFGNIKPPAMLVKDALLSVKPWVEELLEHYGVLCYNGQLDVSIAYSLSMHTYKEFKWSGQEAYYNAKRREIYGPSPYSEKDVIIGYEKSYGNFIDVVLLGAGHMVPLDQPQSAKIMIDKFINKFK